MKVRNLGIFSAIFASICCLGPLILVLVGLGGLGIGAMIGRFHWFFLIAGLTIIVFAWNIYFREKKRCKVNACQMENKKATQIILVVATIVVAIFVGLNIYTYIGKSIKIKPSSPMANLESVIIPDELVNSLRKSNYQDVLENLPNVTYMEGKSHFTSDKEMEVNGERFNAPRFVIATGSSTKVIPIEGLKEVGFLTNRTALELKSLPESLLVIGAGPIGLEFGQIFSRLGSKVTVVELMERILPQSEPVISDELKRCLEEEGMRVITGARTKKVQDGKKKVVQIERDEKLEGKRVLTDSQTSYLCCRGRNRCAVA